MGALAESTFTFLQRVPKHEEWGVSLTVVLRGWSTTRAYAIHPAAQASTALDQSAGERVLLALLTMEPLAIATQTFFLMIEEAAAHCWSITSHLATK